ncbi:MAG: GGDEF domain-containing protein [Usitatibacter sp.]
MVELKSILLFMCAVDVALAAAMWMGASKRHDGLLQWSASLGVRAVAFGLLAGSAGAQSGAIAIGVALAALSVTLQAAAVITYARRSLPAWVHTAVIAGIAVPMQLLAGDPAGSVLFGGVVIGVLSMAVAVIGWQMKGNSNSRARGVLVSSFAIAGSLLVLRGMGAAFVADPLAGLLRPAGLTAFMTLAVFAAAIGGTFAFLQLHKERAEGEVQRLAMLDPLTGAYNRRTFHEIAEREVARARRAGQPLSIVLLDIDNFRAVNEKIGHKAGDEVLQRFVEVVRSALRKEDMLVRYSDEEFLVLLPEVPGPGAVVVAGRIRRSVAGEPVLAAGESFALTVSLGVAARLDEGPEGVDELLARASSALALAKERGRNRVVALSLGRSIAA